MSREDNIIKLYKETEKEIRFQRRHNVLITGKNYKGLKELPSNISTDPNLVHLVECFDSVFEKDKFVVEGSLKDVINGLTQVAPRASNIIIDLSTPTKEHYIVYFMEIFERAIRRGMFELKDLLGHVVPMSDVRNFIRDPGDVWVRYKPTFLNLLQYDPVNK